MKRNTKIIILMIISIAAVTIYVSYKSNFPDKKEIVNKNFENIKKVEIGMSQEEVDSIMGHPYIIIPTSAYNINTVYKYEIPEGESGFCQVMFDSSMNVINVFYFLDENDSTEVFE